MSTKGTNRENVPDELVNFLNYVENTTDAYADSVQDQTIRTIHDKITRLKKSREWEGRYMTFEEMFREAERSGKEEGERKGLEKGLQKGLKKGQQQGQQQGQQRMIKLIDCMTEAGEGELLSRLGKDPEFLESMFEKYHL